MTATLTEYECWVGETLRLYGQFEAGTPGVADPTEQTYANDDPATVTYVLTDPAGGTDTRTWAASQVERHAEGWFYVDYQFNTAGYWTVTATGTGAVAARAVAQVHVKALPPVSV